MSDGGVQESEVVDAPLGTAPASEERNWEELDAVMERHLASLGLRVQMSASKGRSLVATRLFRAGDIVIQQAALAWALIGCDTARCHQCLVPRESLRRCTRCRYAHYCSGDDQKTAWAAHAPECKRIARFKEQNKQVTPMTVMLARVLDAKTREDGAGQYGEGAPPGLRHEDLLTLAAHPGKHSQENMLGYTQVALMLAALFHEGGALEGGVEDEAEHLAELFGFGTGGTRRGAPEPEGGAAGAGGEEKGPPGEVGGVLGREVAAGVEMRGAVEILCRIACNGHTITDSDLRPFGVGIYPLAALANHACLPNCVQTFKGTAITIRAMREIPSGEEVTIAYVDVATPLVQRKADLKERYLFECECGGCSGEEAEAREASKVAWKSDHVSEELRDEALKLAEEACISAEKMRGSADEVLERVLEACAKCEVVLDPLHVSLMRLREHALRLSITIANWEEAERQCEATIAPYRAHYPEGSPLVGLQLATLGKIKAFLGRDLEARNNLSEAAPLLLRAFGQGDPCVKETEERLREVMWSMDGLGEMAERTRAIQPPR